MKNPSDTAAFRQSLLRLLEAGPSAEDRLLAEFERQRRPSQPLYSTLLYILTHLNFSERAAQRHWDRIPNSDIMRPTDNGQNLGPDLDTTDQQAPGIGMDGDLSNPADNDTFERGAPLLYRFHFQPCHGEAVGYGLCRHLHRHELSQPFKTNPHSVPS